MRRRPPIGRHGQPGTPLHRKLVAGLVTRGASTHGFRVAVEDAIGCEFIDAPKIIPDAYYIGHDIRRIGIFEVVVSHGLTPSKLAKIRLWRDWIVGHDWSLRILEVDRNGGVRGISPDDGELDDDSIQRVVDVLAGRVSG